MNLLVYAFAVYFVFHVLSRSDLLAKPRDWVKRTLPGWMTYPLECAFCFTFWATAGLSLLILVTTGWFILDLAQYLVPPVINLIVDGCVRALNRFNDTDGS